MTTTPAPHPSSDEIMEAFGLTGSTPAPAPAPAAESATKTERLERDLVKKKAALPDAYGLYTEYVVYTTNPAYADSPMRKVVKIFIAENMVVTQIRDRGRKAARWKSRTYESQAIARSKVLNWVERMVEADPTLKLEMRGRPQLVQMTKGDVESIRAGRLPSARFAGYNEIAYTEGTLIDEEWKPSGS